MYYGGELQSQNVTFMNLNQVNLVTAAVYIGHQHNSPYIELSLINKDILWFY